MLKRDRDREEKIRSREVRAGRRTGWDGSESGVSPTGSQLNERS